ncbi:DUF4145 domain-containing protein [Sinorhizobium medicae]|nr:DUF4145 domain-containing protein [Sinorhizobium medicae]
MKCPHCSVEAHFSWQETYIDGLKEEDARRVRLAYCPSTDCNRVVAVYDHGTIGIPQYKWSATHLIEPQGAVRKPPPQEVPSIIAEDYIEACNVLSISPKASAALSRRCLQAVLRAHGYKAKDLAKEIDLLLNETDATKAIPQSLRTVVDAVRNFGNFSAHPITDLTTLQIIDVQPEEAEWCLEVLDECFEHFYVRPARAAARKAALDAKLSQAGKPASK